MATCVRNAKAASTKTGTMRISIGLPNTTVVPGPIVNQTSTARNPYSAKAAQYFLSRLAKPLAGFSGPPIQKTSNQQWCTGEDSNLRSSKERQIYSLLPLTARPPVPNPYPCVKPAAEDPSQTCAYPQKTGFRAYCPTRRTSGLSEHAPQWDRRGGQTRRYKTAAPAKTAAASGPGSYFLKWSWRRDLNPRPSDYKSDALPAELRQPKNASQHRGIVLATRNPTPETVIRAGTLLLRAYHGTVSKVSTRRRVEQTRTSPPISFRFRQFGLTLRDARGNLLSQSILTVEESESMNPKRTFCSLFGGACAARWRPWPFRRHRRTRPNGGHASPSSTSIMAPCRPRPPRSSAPTSTWAKALSTCWSPTWSKTAPIR